MARKIIPLVVVVIATAGLLGVAVGIRTPAALGSTFESPDALAAAVLDGFHRQDRRALERLALSREEFERHVWPYLPAARPERNLPMAFVWRDLAAKSRGYLTTNLNGTIPPGARVVKVTFDRDSTDYGAFRVFRRSLVTLTDGAGGTIPVRLFGSVIEQDGRYKVFSYVTD